MTLFVLVRVMSAFVLTVLLVRSPTAICPVITITNGEISYNPATSPILEGAVATHFCMTGYKPSTTSGPDRVCQSNRAWSGDDIICNS